MHVISRRMNHFISIPNKILGSKPSYEEVIFQETRKKDAKGSVLILLSLFIYVLDRDQLEMCRNNNHRMHNNVRIIY